MVEKSCKKKSNKDLRKFAEICNSLLWLVIGMGGVVVTAGFMLIAHALGHVDMVVLGYFPLTCSLLVTITASYSYVKCFEDKKGKL